ncbi:hypothetical protein JOC85_004352 [Bacillus mesophilus]|uniref:Tail specific protease domain-containing protein n=1 Tax=Bacillus mesophilus TaxID=1808955 RepID=A0A6M0QCU5_9BACI|nr:S41 family peptidase [Bacillus mesophilus]MBM7663476.1 hypothetical protein [Bacillus mesophilus]NEY74174.1 hypothetical protein [Bacillus mesophilus]
MSKYIGFVIVVLLLIGGCSKYQPLTDEALASLNEVSEQNLYFTESSLHKQKLPLYDYSVTKDTELSRDVLETLRIVNQESSNSSSSFTKKEILEDIEVMHLSLKYMYALYEYMGGDLTFETARDLLVKDVQAHEEDVMTKAQILHLIERHYHFIADAHFKIDQTPLNTSGYEFFTTSLYSFIQDETGDFWSIGREKAQLLSVNNDHDIESYIRPTINENGDIGYILGIFSPPLNKEEREWRVVLQVGDKKKEEIVELRPESKELSKSRQGSRLLLTEKEGVPWLQIRSMFVLENDPFSYSDIIKTAREVRDEPYLVLDVRGNSGGSMILVKKWLEEFFKKPVSWNSKSIYLFSDTGKTFVQDTVDLYLKQGLSTETFEEGYTDINRLENLNGPLGPTWEVEENEFHQVTDNETQIFILTDGNTASAAEHLVAQLKLANQTTVVGMSTMGAMISGNALIYQLPHTNIKMEVPTYFNYNTDIINKETVGLQPDFWVRPEVTEQRVLAFINKNRDK